MINECGKTNGQFLKKEFPWIDKIIDKFDDKLQQIDKIAHPPAIPLKDINELKESAKNVKWMMAIFKNMRKLPLLKSLFK